MPRLHLRRLSYSQGHRPPVAGHLTPPRATVSEDSVASVAQLRWRLMWSPKNTQCSDSDGTSFQPKLSPRNSRTSSAPSAERRTVPLGASFISHSVVWTISTSVLARRETLPGTDPSSRPAMLLSPTLPTTSRSAWTSSANSTSAWMGSPTIGRPSMSRAPAGLEGPVAGLPQDLQDGGLPVHPVARAPEGVLGAAVTHTIRPWWSDQLPLPPSAPS